VGALRLKNFFALSLDDISDNFFVRGIQRSFEFLELFFFSSPS